MQAGLTTYVHNTLILTFQVKFQLCTMQESISPQNHCFIHGGHIGILDLIMQLIFIHPPRWLTTWQQISVWNQ